MCLKPWDFLGIIVTPLSQKISSRIREAGHPLTFAQFMEMALYDPDHGYYMTGGDRCSGENSDSPIGMDGGDYYTAPCLSPFLAKCLARQLQEIDELLEQPTEFTLLEMGPGEGRCIKDVLDEVTRLDPGLCARLSIILVESSPYLRRLQERMLEANSKTAKIIWASNLGVLDDDSLVGMVLSNELVDAFPVNRVRMTSEGLKEIYVNHVGGQFVEQLEAPSTDELSNSLKALDVDLPVGFTTEINLECGGLDAAGGACVASWGGGHHRLWTYEFGLCFTHEERRDTALLLPSYGRGQPL